MQGSPTSPIFESANPLSIARIRHAKDKVLFTEPYPGTRSLEQIMQLFGGSMSVGTVEEESMPVHC